jgi:hypothetical protein
MEWLAARRYPTATRSNMLWTLPRIDCWLREHGMVQLAQIDSALFAQCWEAFLGTGQRSATVRALERYFAAQGLMRPQLQEPLAPSEQLVAEYERHLENARGLASSTIEGTLRHPC